MGPELRGFRLFFASVVLGAFLATFVLSAIGHAPHNEATDYTIQGLMVILAGYLFGPAIAGRGRRDAE